MRRKGNPSTLLVGMQTGAATVENSMEFPQKTKNGTANCAFSNGSLCFYLMGSDSLYQGPENLEPHLPHRTGQYMCLIFSSLSSSWSHCLLTLKN